MTRLTECLLCLAQALGSLGLVNGYAHLIHPLQSRQINSGQLASSYDYIVVGGGQSGLVIANRLSEDTSKTVLIVEYGTFDADPNQIEPSSATNYKAKNLFNVTAANQPALNNRAGTVYAANVVGGGSTVNGMLFDRGSADEYDNWERLGNTGWGWNGLLPYFKKSTTYTPPSTSLAADYNITWDLAAYGSGPIQVTYPDWAWPGVKIQFKAWNEIGATTPMEGALGDASGAYWVPSNVDQQYRRSYAVSGYYNPASSRSNLQLLTYYRVNEIQFDNNNRAQSVTVQARGTANGASTITVKANQEIVLCAGWLHTPQILQRSGIGPRALLQQAGITVRVDLPGVGSNLQDHPAFGAQATYQSDVQPNPSSLYTNTTFQQYADQLWQQRKGPRSVGVGNSLATVALPILSPTWQDTITKLKSQGTTYLPSSYTAEQKLGWQAQRDVLAASFSKTDNGVVEIPFSGSPATSLVLERPLSRGTVLVSTIDRYAEPLVDFNTNINPVDVDIEVAMLKYYRRWLAAPSHQQLRPVESSPGTSVSTDAQISNFISQSLGTSTAHSCCTAAMGPREQGYVLASDLTVYGVTSLSVGDISLIPLIPATHTCATVYAIAEKAADLIKARAGTAPPTSSSTTSSSSSTTITTTTSIIASTTTTKTSSTTMTTTTPTAPACSVAKWGQCGGQTYSGCKVCASGSTCQYSNPYYSQCL